MATGRPDRLDPHEPERVGEAVGRHLHRLANAIDERPVEPHQQPKSMSQEETYEFDRHDPDELDRELLRMSDAVAARLRKAELFARTVTVKVRFGDFRTITRSETLPRATDASADLVRTARRLLASVDTSPGVRLLGVGATGLEVDSPEQLSFEDLAAASRSADDARAADHAVDEIRRRFGTTAIGPATLVDPEQGIGTRTRNEKPWG